MDMSVKKSAAYKIGTVTGTLLIALAVPGLSYAWTDFEPAGPQFNNFDIHSPGANTTIYATSQTAANNGVWKLPVSGPPWDSPTLSVNTTSVAVDPKVIPIRLSRHAFRSSPM